MLSETLSSRGQPTILTEYPRVEMGGADTVGSSMPIFLFPANDLESPEHRPAHTGRCASSACSPISIAFYVIPRSSACTCAAGARAATRPRHSVGYCRVEIFLTLLQTTLPCAAGTGTTQVRTSSGMPCRSLLAMSPCRPLVNEVSTNAKPRLAESAASNVSAP